MLKKPIRRTVHIRVKTFNTGKFANKIYYLILDIYFSQQLAMEKSACQVIFCCKGVPKFLDHPL